MQIQIDHNKIVKIEIGKIKDPVSDYKYYVHQNLSSDHYSAEYHLEKLFVDERSAQKYYDERIRILNAEKKF
jgi:hypothetical protein